MFGGLVAEFWLYVALAVGYVLGVGMGVLVMLLGFELFPGLFESRLGETTRLPRELRPQFPRPLPRPRQASRSSSR